MNEGLSLSWTLPNQKARRSSRDTTAHTRGGHPVRHSPPLRIQSPPTVRLNSRFVQQPRPQVSLDFFQLHPTRMRKHNLCPVHRPRQFPAYQRRSQPPPLSSHLQEQLAQRHWCPRHCHVRRLCLARCPSVVRVRVVVLVVRVGEDRPRERPGERVRVRVRVRG